MSPVRPSTTAEAGKSMTPAGGKQPAHFAGLLWAGLALIALIAAGVIVPRLIKDRAPISEPAAVSLSKTTTPAVKPAVPFVKQHIYSETSDPRADIAAALVQAKRGHKRVILDFGGDWCGDCQVLDIYFRQAPNADLLAQNFIVVHVWIGPTINVNLDIPEKYGVAIKKGVPALAVLSPDGKTLYSQRTGEFEDMRHMEPESVTEFLNKWKS